MDDRSGLTLTETSTFAYSRVVCLEWMYPIHILGAYLLVVTGIGALVTRVLEGYKHYHVWFGRAFMVIMYWTYATSLLITNVGLPIAIIIFFFTKLISMTIGWLVIKKHASVRRAELMRRVAASLKVDFSVNGMSLEEIMSKHKKIMNSELTTFASRFLTWKSLHGVLMTYVWYTMLGRTLVTNPAEFEGCWTYPAFKTETGVIEYLPREEPGYRTPPAQELAFGFGTFLGGFAFITIVGALYSRRAANLTKEAAEAPPVFQEEASDDSTSTPKKFDVKQVNSSSSEYSLSEPTTGDDYQRS